MDTLSLSPIPTGISLSTQKNEKKMTTETTNPTPTPHQKPYFSLIV